MVTILRKWTIVICGALACGSGVAKADGVLEKMQSEVADLAEKMRGAVVTIQDERGVLQSGDMFIFSDPLGDARGRIFKTEADRKSLSDQRVALERRIQSVKAMPKSEANAKALEELLTRHVELLQRLDSLKAENELSSSHLKTLRRDLFVERLSGKKGEDVFVREGSPLVGDAMQKALQNTDKKAREVKIFVSKTGSGFCIGDGYVVTTGDVALSLRQPIVITDNGTRLKARVVGSHPDLNIGLLKITASTPIPSLKMGDSDSVKAGHFAVSMGNQAGQSNSVALMLVGNIRSEGTYAGRQFYPSLIQIAGTVGAGASGAPLVNVRGEVIGMMAAIPVDGSAWSTESNPHAELFRGDGSPQETKGIKIPYQAFPEGGILSFMSSSPAVTSAGFAIPINQIKPVIDELRLEKPIARGWIGIAPEDVSRIVEKGNGIIDTEVTVRVVGVYPESPAMAAGVQPGDVIVSVDGKPVRNAGVIRQTSLRIRRGDRLSLAVRRGKETKTLNLRIDLRPQTIKPPITATVKESF